jgi:hypothetical protein
MGFAGKLLGGIIDVGELPLDLLKDIKNAEDGNTMAKLAKLKDRGKSLLSDAAEGGKALATEAREAAKELKAKAKSIREDVEEL